MLLSVRGQYKDGVVTPAEPIEGLPEQDVTINFLAKGEDIEDVLAYMNAPVMSKEGYLELLKRYDDPLHLEWLGGWNNAQYEAATAKFLIFAQHLQIVLGGQCVIESGSLIQDAIFLGSIAPPRECFVIDGYGQVRVSNFGDLITFYRDEAALKQNCLDIIKVATLKYGYKYIPSSVLSEPYTGSNPYVREVSTWGIRYFDWV